MSVTEIPPVPQAAVIRQHWNTVAGQWQHFGPPLRPCAEDIRLFHELAAAFGPAEARTPWQVLMLGVTPEIAVMHWPRPAFLTAIDRSPEMVEIVWPGDVAGRRRAFTSEWTASPAAKPDIVIGDGSFISMGYPDGYRQLCRHIAGLLRPGGLLLARFFLRPERVESVDHVLRDLSAGRIGSFHAFKWRLAMAVQTSITDGVRLHDIWEAWSGANIASIPGRGPGWSAPEIATVDLYRGKDTRFAFASRQELDLVLREQFDVLAERVPQYELGERCPILALTPRSP